MIGNKLELDIISVFNRDPTLFLSINQIAKKLNRSYPYINSKVNELIDEDVLNISPVGRSHLCSINLSNDKAVALLSLNEISKKEKMLKKIKQRDRLMRDLKDIREKFKVHTVLYLEGSLVFVLDYLNDKEAIKNLYPGLSDMELLFFDKQGFKDLLKRDSGIYKKSIVLYSYERYFEMINDEMGGLVLKQLRGGGRR